ncbi:MAG TPA: hypothetical protein VF754_04285, partial [Pyrinomonadaceae bacterium]
MLFRPRYSLRPFAVAALVASTLAVLFTHALSVVTPAQERRGGQPVRPSRREGNKVKAQQRQQKLRRQAVAALVEAAEAARDFEGLFEKVAVQASAADTLWPFDAERARAIVRRAWEATLAPGAAESLADDETTAYEYLKAAQRLVVETAARHDARLSEEFMREFVRESSEATEATPADGRSGARRLSAAGWQRLSIASSLLRAGDPQSAARVAAPLVGEGATRELLGFILELRAQDAGEADALYVRLLERTRADASADANDVLLLSTPIVSPELFVYVGSDGALSYAQSFYRSAPTDGRRAASPLPTAARRAFFDVAASVLLRADAASAQGKAAALYYAIRRLLPFFEREATQHVAALNARQAALGASVETDIRDSLTASVDTRTFAHRNPR